MKNLCFLQSLLDLNAPEKQSLFPAFKFIAHEMIKPVFDGKPRGFFAVFKIEGFFWFGALKLDNSIVKTG